MASLLPEWSSVARPVIGMLHLPPLPGSPGFDGKIDAIIERALGDAEALARGGVHGLMMENFGDVPFYPGRVPVAVVAHMTRVAQEVRVHCALPLGINVLRNDGLAALAVAHAVGASFIRVNVLCGARVTDQGIINGIAHELLRERHSLGARHIRILADVDVKHSAPLGPPQPIEIEVNDTIQRGAADAIIVSGSGTGQATDIESLRSARAAAGATPVLIGSGVNADNIADYLDRADGFIVGTALKQGGVATNPVDASAVKRLMSRVG